MHPNYQPKRFLFWKDKKADRWVAQCVDFDLMAHAKTKEDLPKALGYVYYGEIVVALENNLPLSFKPAPEWVVVAWARQTEKSTDTKKIAWSEFVPEWFAPALGKLASTFKDIEKEQVELVAA